MANYYSIGDKDIVDRLIQDFTFEIGFSSSPLPPFDLKGFESFEESTLRTPATTEKTVLVNASGSVGSGFTSQSITQLKISADINTNNVSGTFDCKHCGVILKKDGVVVELMSLEPLQEQITSSSTLSVEHTYTFKFNV